MHTIEQNENVMIYGPVIMNAEVVSYKNSWEDVKIAGISQGRENEKAQAAKTYPHIEKFQDVTQKGILIALEDGQVDAVIQDLTKAAKVSQYPLKPLSETDYISYVLVVDKDFAKTNTFINFIKSYNKAAKKLNQPEYLAEKLGVETKWLENVSIEFLPYNSFGILKNILNDSFNSDSLTNVSINSSSNIWLNTLLVLVKLDKGNLIHFFPLYHIGLI